MGRPFLPATSAFAVKVLPAPSPPVLQPPSVRAPRTAQQCLKGPAAAVGGSTCLCHHCRSTRTCTTNTLALVLASTSTRNNLRGVLYRNVI